jgi:hypothetical protein
MVPISGCSFLSEVLCTGTSGMHHYMREADGKRSGFLGDENSGLSPSAPKLVSLVVLEGRT